MTRKIVQLTSHDGCLYAVCDDGTAWRMAGWSRWIPLDPVIPQDDPAMHRTSDPGAST